MRDNRLIEAISAYSYRFRVHNPIERDNRDFRRTATNVDNHRAACLLNRQSCSNSRRHRLFDETHVASTRTGDRLTNRTALNLSRLAGHADQHSGTGWKETVFVHLVDEVLKHLLGDLKIGDHAVFKRPDGHNVARRSTEHALRIGANSGDAFLAVMSANSDHRRLV